MIWTITVLDCHLFNFGRGFPTFNSRFNPPSCQIEIGYFGGFRFKDHLFNKRNFSCLGDLPPEKLAKIAGIYQVFFSFCLPKKKMAIDLTKITLEVLPSLDSTFSIYQFLLLEIIPKRIRVKTP